MRSAILMCAISMGNAARLCTGWYGTVEPIIHPMKTSSERPRAKLYLLLLAVQILGAITFIWQQLPEFREIAINPGIQLQNNSLSDLVMIGILCAMQIPFWYRVRCVPIPLQHPNMFLSHTLHFLGRLSFIFGSALFSLAAFRHLPELDGGADIWLATWRGAPLTACLFALFCTSLEMERLGHAFEGSRN